MVISILFLLVTTVCISFTRPGDFSNDSLRRIYSRPPATWPAPAVDPGIGWTELGILPSIPVNINDPSLAPKIELGKRLFFDKGLSGSGKISCASCHQPALNWTDGKSKSIGHEGSVNKRNSPTIQNTWFYKTLFWDGRARSLEDQAFAPLNSETEMHNEMPSILFAVNGNKNYKALFKNAFGDDDISAERLTEAIAIFERTITGALSKFDLFLSGKKNALNSSELRGLHIFRTKAGCMNCHNGPLFTDNHFHNNGFAGKDPGRYFVTHQVADSGKFKTPSLRDVTRTGPWMHDGSVTSIQQIIKAYNEKNRNRFDPLLKDISLSAGELKDLQSFLEAISANPVQFSEPIFD